MQQIKSQEQLDSLVTKGVLDFFIKLNFNIKSSKEIVFTKQKDYYVYNDSDDTVVIIKRSELKDSFLGRALKAGALFSYD